MSSSSYTRALAAGELKADPAQEAAAAQLDAPLFHRVLQQVNMKLLSYVTAVRVIWVRAFCAPLKMSTTSLLKLQLVWTPQISVRLTMH